jgi:hypothetical protein
MRDRRPAPLSAIGGWKPQSYLIAIGDFTTEIFGRVSGGLGMLQVRGCAARDATKPEWSLTHVGTGHRVCLIRATEVEAFAIATEIAALTNWDFVGVDGWKSRDSAMPRKVRSFARRYGDKVILGTGGPQDRTLARQVAEARA